MRRTRVVRSILIVLLLSISLMATLPVQAQESATPEEIDALLTDLETGDFLAQEQAGQKLAEIGSPMAIPRLRGVFLNSDNPRPAAVALAGIGTPRAMTILVSGLADEELTARRNAAQVALLEAGEQAVTPLVAGLHSSDPVIRRNAAGLLGFIGSSRAVNALLQVAREDDDPRVREEAVWALGEIGEDRVRGTLKAIARTDPDLGVQAEAQRAVLRLGEWF